MSGKRKAPTGAATSAGAELGQASRQGRASNSKHTTPTTGRQMKIAVLLSCGAENAVTLRDLVTITGLPERVVRRQIQAERKAGALILADCEHGYFLPGSTDELRHFIQQMQHRAGEILLVARMAESVYLENLGQETVEGW